MNKITIDFDLAVATINIDSTLRLDIEYDVDAKKVEFFLITIDGKKIISTATFLYNHYTLVHSVISDYTKIGAIIDKISHNEYYLIMVADIISTRYRNENVRPVHMRTLFNIFISYLNVNKVKLASSKITNI